MSGLPDTAQLWPPSRRTPEYAREIPIVHRHLISRKNPAGTLDVDGATTLTVYIEARRAAAGKFPGTSLPCFR